MTTIAILDPFSGIAGDMTLGALLDLGLDPDWLRALPGVLGLEGIGVRIERVKRGEIASWKVDFDIPPQPHGRHLKHLKAIVDASTAPDAVKARANAAFEAVATIEAEIHGTTVERVHLHEVGAVDAILDIVGSVWGMHLLGIERVYHTTVALGDGFVDAAHGRLAVPAPATLRLLEGIDVRPGPPESGELTTPTGAALLRVLSLGAAPAEYRPIRSGYGAGTKDPNGRANVLRIILAEADEGEAAHETLAMLAADLDDMTGEYVAAAADALRDAGALDVTLLQTLMKKGRPGVRIEVLCRPGDAGRLEDLLLRESSSIGVRRGFVQRRALPRSARTVEVFGHDVTLKTVQLPGGGEREKAEFEDIRRVAAATGHSTAEILEAVTKAG
ncbi:MAG: nickel pincer cofactor biosynthesis protein LarC [Gemmatimonadetes bacterium]|nr:nickel pincer cofactor biosynthesis protein LarC [Gemmatimonadota bacterium]MBI3566873.1 nickel pincer cofactor biosynthesis protein LarC [Gemmatimonadota bacterium]